MNYQVVLILVIFIILFYVYDIKNKNQENYDLIEKVRRGLGQTL
jgi:hypothetical protein